jgi:hypothetical protein
MSDKTQDHCFRCQAPADKDALACEKCGIPLVREVYDLHLSERKAKAEALVVRRFATMASGAALIAGLVLGAAIRGAFIPDATEVSATPLAETVEDPATARALANSFIVQQLEGQLKLGIVNWRPAPTENGIILDLAGPNSTVPVPLWELLSATDQKELVTQIALAYATGLKNAGFPTGIDQGTRPAVFVAYYGQDQPVAMSDQDGVVHVYPSPYAQARQP